ncbi:hypothetical protein, partial [Belliella aquatica]|uniref:hypothetical protein n=1 Tax=Belliella aquatica TaxID=1323734 RepID=UPI001E2F46FF
LPLAWLRDVTPALKGLSPVGTVNFLTYIHHSRHTQVDLPGFENLTGLTNYTPKTIASDSISDFIIT